MRHLYLFMPEGLPLMKIRTLVPLILALLILPTDRMYAQFNYLETKNAQIIYVGNAYDYILSHLARCYENTLAFESGLFGYRPEEKTTIYLHDFSDMGNAGATSVPHNFIMMELAPKNYIFETTPSNERINWTTNHEMVHIVTTDQATRSDRFFRKLFLGKVWPAVDNPPTILYSYLTNPRKLTPRWYLEGIAVFLETWMAGGLGRAQGAYDEMVFRSMVRDGARFYDVVGLESEGTTIDFQVGVNSYLYGTRFMSYLAYQYGPEKVLQWTQRTAGSKRYFINRFKQVFGAPLSQEWGRWVAWEKEFQQANLDSVRKYPITPTRPIFHQALGSLSRAFYNPERRVLYMAVSYPGQIAHIAALHVDTGRIEKLYDIKGPALYFVASLAYDPDSDTIFFTTDNSRWRDLYSFDLKTGKAQELMKNMRCGDFAFNCVDRSIWAVRHFNGISTLVRIPAPYREWNQVWSFPYGNDLFDLDVSPDGGLLTAALVERDGKQKLIKMETASLLKGTRNYSVIFDFENSLPQSFVFSPDGRYLYGSSYYSGVSNLYRYDLQKEDMEIISNCESGLFRPIPYSADSLIAMHYTGRGFQPVIVPIQQPKQISAVTFLGNQIVKKYPVVRTWMAGSPARINFDSIKVASGPYHAIRQLRLDSAYPIVQGYKDYAAYGYQVRFSDRIGLAALNLSAGYTPNPGLPEDERTHLALDGHWSRLGFSAAYNYSDFFDLFGPTKQSMKGYSAELRYDKNLIWDKPRSLDVKMALSGYGGLERLPDEQNVSATYDRAFSFSASLVYENVRKSLGWVDDEKGSKAQLDWNNFYVNGRLYPRWMAAVDQGFQLPIHHSSVWLRGSAGYSPGERDNPFANFFFGGFGNNWVDYQDEKRYRESPSFPGVDIDAVGGINFAKAMLEWNLPPVRFRHIGLPNLYLRWARPALFVSGLTTNLGYAAAEPPRPQYGARRTLFNAGGQLDFRVVLLSRLDSMLSLGYASAIEKKNWNSEFMISLKVQ